MNSSHQTGFASGAGENSLDVELLLLLLFFFFFFFFFLEGGSFH